MKLTDQYRVYNFSSTRCFVVGMFVDNPIKKIEVKLPPIAKRLTGVFVSCLTDSNNKLIGVLNLNFNDGALKPYNIPVINSTNTDLKNTSPVVFDEPLKPHSSMTGYYRDLGLRSVGPGTYLFLKVYIHFTT